jgi:hypothetical protein
MYSYFQKYVGGRMTCSEISNWIAGEENNFLFDMHSLSNLHYFKGRDL